MNHDGSAPLLPHSDSRNAVLSAVAMPITPIRTALRIVTALLIAQGIIRAGMTIYLWYTFPATANERAGAIATVILLWVPLSALNIAAALAIAWSKRWAPACGLAVCGLGAAIDACFMFLTVGYWTLEPSPDWDFFDLVLWTSSTLYVVVYIVSLIYLYHGSRAEPRTA
jgi:hypothetical protein